MTESLPKPIPGWCVYLEGHKYDLEHWHQALQHPFDPWCEWIRRGDGLIFVLRSGIFDNLRTEDEVLSRALPLIDQLNGALFVTGHTEPVSLEAVGRIRADGQVNLSFFERVRLQARATASASADLTEPSGKVAPPPPERSLAQQWISVSAGDSRVALLLTLVGNAHTWVDIFKVVEAAETIAGGQRALEARVGTRAGELRRMVQTANSHRHAGLKHRPPKPPVTLEAAKSLLVFVVRTVLGA